MRSLPARGDRRFFEPVERGRVAHEVPVLIGLAACVGPGRARHGVRERAHEPTTRRCCEYALKRLLCDFIGIAFGGRLSPVPEHVSEETVAGHVVSPSEWKRNMTGAAAIS